jgi:hypothetical protein
MSDTAGSPILQLDQHVAGQIKGMLARGDRLVDIAVWFGLNLRIVHAVQSGAVHPFVPVAPNHALPPPGPYAQAAHAYSALQGVEEAEVRLARRALRAICL